jgi:formylglycine-generating enzyme required for sulfatase activity
MWVDTKQMLTAIGWGGSLPTEAQWEKAARGTDGHIYPWGDQAPDTDRLNYNMNIGDTTGICSYPEGNSPYGLCDMAGNVWEWVNDWYEAKYYQSSDASNPLGPANGDYKVLRGASWGDEAVNVRVSNRNWGWGGPGDWGGSIRFRCVR